MSWQQKITRARAQAGRARTLVEVEVQRKLTEHGVDSPEEALGRVGDQVRIQARAARELASEKLRDRGYDVPESKPLILRDGTIYIPKD